MRQTRDEYFLSLLTLVAGRSTCARRSVGAIIVDADGHVLSTGYNGPPRGFAHCTEEPCPGRHDPAGDTRRCLAVHAEANALLQCADLRFARTMYVSCSPCSQCAKMICNTPIKRIVTLEHYAEQSTILQTAGIEVIVANGLKP